MKSQLDPEDVRELIDVLRRERDATALTRRERLVSRWLTLLGLRIIPAFLLIVLIVVALPFSASDSVSAGLAVLAIFGLALIVIAAAGLVLIPLAVTILFKAVRQWWLVRRMNLTEQFHEVRVGRPRGGRLGRWLTIGFALLSLAFGVVVLVAWYGERPRQMTSHVGLALGLAFCLAPGFAWLARWSQERLEVLSDLERLTGLLSRSQAPVGEGSQQPVVLPAATLTQIAQIERTQITRDRVQALSEARATPLPEWAVAKSAAVQAALRSLDVTTRLFVEDQIQGLSSRPMSSPPADGEGSEIVRIPVANTSLSLLLRVDRRARRMAVLEIERARPVSMPPGSSESSGG